MEIVKISNEMKVTDILPDGIAMIKIDDKSIIPDLFFLRVFDISENPFQTKGLINKNLFEKNHIIKISIEYVEEYGKDEINGKDIILFAVVNQLCSGGVYLKYFDEDKGRFWKVAFYNGKGLITLPKMRVGNPFEIGDFVKITILRRN